ncbi:MarR family transcriptional regulator [Paenibacillus urinalis]|uniref:MarR family transcriptional regulator n=1 Tax=Paenibacillus urinalis TaxID=521520 RepID=A0ABY7X3M4_9BACL|nr:MarR family transcriptional regulator [Paenibacillus urinalis]WDH96549.1 MarR family transcriptional regulator [Paenibacillus urinalis]WDI00196.1 MarR family transcriptional regulator [Paenibacillus urinalis]
MEESPRELLQVTARRFGLLNKNCCSVGTNEISMIQSHILYEIDRQHEPSMQQIADSLGKDITTFGRQVQTLIKKNLVKKTTHPEDRRVYILHLTTEGEFVATTIDENMNSYLNEFFSFMNADDSSIL